MTIKKLIDILEQVTLIHMKAVVPKRNKFKCSIFLRDSYIAGVPQAGQYFTSVPVGNIASHERHRVADCAATVAGVEIG